jgi:DNA-binding NtrC family response regulator
MNRPRILVVDDEIDFSTGLSDVFSVRGYNVETACDGLAALSMIAANSFDAIILDVRMPGMDGIQVLNEILHLAPGTPTILMTGDHLLSDNQAKPTNGAFAYLLKPYPVLELVALIDRAVADKQALKAFHSVAPAAAFAHRHRQPFPANRQHQSGLQSPT